MIATAGPVVFLTLAIAAAAGLFEQPVRRPGVFIAVPAIFVLGLLLMPLGLWLSAARGTRRRSADATGPSSTSVSRRFGGPPSSSRRSPPSTSSILLLAGYGSLHYMESPSFCGQTCHTPMRPQHTAWQHTTHSQVDCVQCHIGEGAQAFVRYKLAGVRQLVHVVTNNYPRPIPASVADLRPALEVCAHCHDPQTQFRRAAPRVSRVCGR